MKKIIKITILNLFFFLITILGFAQQATEESNAILLKQVEENNKRLEILRTEDSLQKILIEQSGDIDSAIDTTPGMTGLNKEYGQLASPNSNPDPSAVVKGPDSTDIQRSTLSKLIDSVPPIILYLFWGLVAIFSIKFIFRNK